MCARPDVSSCPSLEEWSFIQQIGDLSTLKESKVPSRAYSADAGQFTTKAQRKHMLEVSDQFTVNALPSAHDGCSSRTVQMISWGDSASRELGERPNGRMSALERRPGMMLVTHELVAECVGLELATGPETG